MDEATFAKVGERLTQALLTGDFDLYRAVMDTPITIEPQEGTAYTLEDTKALRCDYDLYHLAIKARGVTDIYRKVIGIRSTGTGGFDVTCLVNILAGAERIVDPFESVMSLHKTKEGWRFYHIRSPLRHIKWTLGQAPI